MIWITAETLVFLSKTKYQAMNTKKDDFQSSHDFLKNIAETHQSETGRRMAEMLHEKMEEDKEEIIRSQTELPVIKPTDGGPDSYVQLKEIMIRGYKTPEWDENGHSVSRPVLNSESGILDFGLYSLVSFNKFVVASPRYNRYIDEPIILFSEHDRKIILCLPKDGVSIAVKSGGLEGFSLNPDLIREYHLEYIYLAMRHERFLAQFPEGMNALSLLNGWIPRMDFEKQKVVIKQLRDKSCEELSEGLEILSC